METTRQESERSMKIKLGEAIERILVESGLSISEFSRRVGYSRQYIYELLKTRDTGFARKIQLDTLKRICDATGYSLRRLLIEIGYIPNVKSDDVPNTVIVVRRNGDRVAYPLDERGAALVEGLSKSLAREDQ